MRKNAYWMKQQDDRILEYLEEEGWATPSVIASQACIDISEGHVHDRLLMLWYVDFVSSIHGDMFEITTDGMLYLEGRVDAGNRPVPTVDRVLRG